jgi:hypothetical protein
MRKYLVAAVLVATFATPALAEQFYIAFDEASKKCEMMHSIPGGGKKNMGGPYASEAAAHKAMAGMKECN